MKKIEGAASDGDAYESNKSEGIWTAGISIRALLRKHFPRPKLPPKPDLPRPLFTGVIDFPTY